MDADANARYRLITPSVTAPFVAILGIGMNWLDHGNNAAPKTPRTNRA